MSSHRDYYFINVHPSVLSRLHKYDVTLLDEEVSVVVLTGGYSCMTQTLQLY